MESYNSSQKISEIKANMRLSMMDYLEQLLKKDFEIVGRVGSNEIAVVNGTYTDEDGCPMDTSVVIKVSAKPFYDKEPHIKENGSESRRITRYDTQTKIENYKLGVEE